MRNALPTIILGSALLLTGCRPKTFETELEAILQNEYKMTIEEAKVGVVKGERDLFLTRTEKNGKEEYNPNYNSVTITERIEQMKSMSKDVDELLSYNDEEIVQLVDEFKIREQLQKDERVIQFNLERYTIVSLYQDFCKLMGIEKDVAPVNETKLLCPWISLENLLQFDAKYVEDARKTMVPFDDFILTYKFVQEIPNPEYPHKDNTKATIKVPKEVALRLVSYDLDSPRDYNPDYIEVFRGKEKKPAIKIFRSTGSTTLDVYVVDTDKEGERGYGSPNEIGNISQVIRASDVYDNHKELLIKIFAEKIKPKRMRPIENEKIIRIVKVGELQSDPWRYDYTNGFAVPLEYNFGNNYLVAYKFKSLQKKDKKNKQGRELEWFAHRWIAHNTIPEQDITGRVITYHRVKPEYAKDVLSANISGQHVTLTRLGMPDVAGDISLFIEKIPYKISYDWGDNRYQIENKDNKLPLYEAQLEQVKPFFHELDLLKDGDGEEASSPH